MLSFNFSFLLFKRLKKEGEHCEGHQPQYTGNHDIEFLFGRNRVEGRCRLFDELSVIYSRFSFLQIINR